MGHELLAHVFALYLQVAGGIGRFMWCNFCMCAKRAKTLTLTWFAIINSARAILTLHPPPSRNVICPPVILKDGRVSVPWGPSPRIVPAGASFEGRSSNPPIHQFPCWWAGSLPRAVGLSPNVGWLSSAAPVFNQPSIPSSKSNLQTSKKQMYKLGKNASLGCLQFVAKIRLV